MTTPRAVTMHDSTHNENAPSGTAPVLHMRGITKRFPRVLANDRVDFVLERGQIHALLGENGAGKSTLMNILYGLYSPDEGEVLLNGKPVGISNPKDAIHCGIGMVHQHFMLVPVMTVAENMIVGNETTCCGGVLDMATATRQIRDLSATYGLDIDPGVLVQDLPVGIRQRVEILKALYRKADVLILDEPTAVLTPDETEASSSRCANSPTRANRSFSSPTSSRR
jgi:ABC-type uncharacterized transport system ATPase subunit